MTEQSPNSNPSTHESTEQPAGPSQEAISTAAPDAEPPSEQAVDNRPAYSVFTKWQKSAIVLGAALGAFFSPLTAQIYFPALPELQADFNVSATQINLTITTYMIFQGITPMFLGSFADASGRRPAYLICFVIYIAANIGCALAPNYAAMLVLRCVQSAGSSTTVALCQAVVADIVTSAERGQYIGYVSVPIILAPALGPVLGGIFGQYLGWRWIFWFLTILAGFCSIMYALFMPETCRNIVGDGSLRPPVAYRTFWQIGSDYKRARKARRAQGEDLGPTLTRQSTKRSIHLPKYNPFKALVILFEMEMFIVLMYGGLIFAGFYAVATAMSSQFSDIYGLNTVDVGLMYLPMGAGSIVAAAVLGKMINWNYRRHCRKLNIPYDRKRQQDLAGFPIEKARLEIGLPLLALSAAVLFSWGWALQYHAHLAVSAVLLFLMGIGIIGFSNTMSTLIVDIHPGHAGSATAANNLTRCLIGAAASAAVDPMINGIGDGWTFTIFGFIYLSAIPVFWFIMQNGVKWRKAKAERDEARRAKHEAKQGRELDVPAHQGVAEGGDAEKPAGSRKASDADTAMDGSAEPSTAKEESA